VSGFEPDCPVWRRLVRLKISAQTGHRYIDIYRSRPSIFGFRTELGNRSRVSIFSTCRPGNRTCISCAITLIYLLQPSLLNCYCVSLTPLHTLCFSSVYSRFNIFYLVNYTTHDTLPLTHNFTSHISFIIHLLKSNFSVEV